MLTPVLLFLLLEPSDAMRVEQQQLPWRNSERSPDVACTDDANNTRSTYTADIVWFMGSTGSLVFEQLHQMRRGVLHALGRSHQLAVAGVVEEEQTPSTVYSLCGS
jgi:hypothetical protein